jgi:hypothetical protein
MIRNLVLFCMITTAAVSQEFVKAIEDNSFFIEEAYNQEAGVIQHIFTGSSFSAGHMLETSVTEEWPLSGRSHQISVTVPYFSRSLPSAHGIGDVMLNYRYQLIDEPGLAFSPRVSVVLPTGNTAQGFGSDAIGMQVNLPLSRRFSDTFVTHGNAGVTWLPEAKTDTTTATFTEYFLGVSAIYLSGQNFNIMLELLYTGSASGAISGSELIINPGFRWAIDIGALQIVPGLAFPFTVSSNGGSNGIFLYTSFEHFF